MQWADFFTSWFTRLNYPDTVGVVVKEDKFKWMLRSPMSFPLFHITFFVCVLVTSVHLDRLLETSLRTAQSNISPASVCHFGLSHSPPSPMDARSCALSPSELRKNIELQPG